MASRARARARAESGHFSSGGLVFLLFAVVLVASYVSLYVTLS